MDGVLQDRQRHPGRDGPGPGLMLPPEVPHRTIGQFCDHVCMYVRFRPDHDAITEELTGHLEDHKDVLLEGDPDMPLLEAEYRAVASMGDAEELGRWLDSIHSPVLGWFQIWFFRAVVLVGVLALLLLLPQAERAAQQLAARPPELEISENSRVIAALHPEGAWSWQDYTFSIPQAVETQDWDGRSVKALLKIAHPNPWRKEPDLLGSIWAEDDLGNRYDSMDTVNELLSGDGYPAWRGDCWGSTAARFLFATYCEIEVRKVDPAAAKLTLHLDRYGEDVLWLTIPLEGGGGNG
ncbi:hypothetical protein [uncultured Flavonifractor sp.]|uniref:hypothetical protein n=1 Tax=uncultured Flavonifractor sp. TaxID=1193534 RepID=UPI0025F62975|nr:hypothetical protein [uncultured Flavonifractor sp.]